MPKLSHFTLLMSLFYLGLGALFLFTTIWIEAIPNYRLALGGAFVGYGALRMWVWFRKRKHEAGQ